MIPCVHYERGPNDERVQRCLGIVASRRVWVHRITRLEDHKGVLHVHSTKPLPSWHQKIWSEAWSECGEPYVEFVVDDE